MIRSGSCRAFEPIPTHAYPHHTAFNPETVSLLTEVLNRAAAGIPPEQRTNQFKTRLASNILGAASSGEAPQFGFMRLHSQSAPKMIRIGPGQP